MCAASSRRHTTTRTTSSSRRDLPPPPLPTPRPMPVHRPRRRLPPVHLPAHVTPPSAADAHLRAPNSTALNLRPMPVPRSRFCGQAQRWDTPPKSEPSRVGAPSFPAPSCVPRLPCRHAPQTQNERRSTRTPAWRPTTPSTPRPAGSPATRGFAGWRGIGDSASTSSPIRRRAAPPPISHPPSPVFPFLHTLPQPKLRLWFLLQAVGYHI